MARPRYATEKFGQRVGTMRPDTAPSKAEQVEPGQGRCTSCGRVINLTTVGILRKHKDRQGNQCWCHDYEGSRPLVVELPAIHFPEPGRPPSGRPATSPRAARQATGECHTCGRPVSGERWYCGPCLAARP